MRSIATPRTQRRLASVVAALACVACASVQAQDALTILPGDARFRTPEFGDYEAVYTSASSKSGGFTLQARLADRGRRLSLVDIIPMKEDVIVAQRGIDLRTQRVEFSAGPYFAWGEEFVVAQAGGHSYDWARVPIGGGEPKRSSGEVAHDGYVTDLFSPTLAALMPMEAGTRFRLPIAYPRKGEFVSVEFDEYEVLRRERLDLPSGIGCDCWVIEKKAWSGATSRIWVAREAPFVFRRHRDVGGRRDFVSDVLAFHQLAH